MIKRIQVIYPGGRFTISSDNRWYNPAECDPDEVKANDKVNWFGRSLEREGMLVEQPYRNL